VKISLYGNALNLAFLLGLFLRRKGHEVQVFVDANASENDRPEWECVHGSELEDLSCVSVDVSAKRLLIGGRRERTFRQVLAEADVVQTFGEGVIWSAGCGAPDTVLSIGDDLDVLPFRRESVRIIVYAKMLLRAQRRCRAICYSMPPQDDSCRKLHLSNARFFPCAVPIDVDRFAPLSREERARIRERWGILERTLVVFQPSRQEWTCAQDGSGSNHKGNDRFLRAFARFRQDTGEDAWLFAVTKGRDVRKSQQLAEQLGIEDRIRWLPQQNKAALRECLGASDVVADQFTYGFYGISALEAMAVGRPVLVYLNLEETKRYGVEPPPVVSVCTEEDIYEALRQLARSRSRVNEIGDMARDWTIRHHSWEVVVERYVALYRELIAGSEGMQEKASK